MRILRVDCSTAEPQLESSRRAGQRALLDGFTGAGLFRRLTYPGAPTHMIDPRSVEEILQSGELGEKLSRLLREHERADRIPPQQER
jgi:hypothetical protein